MPRIYLGLGSNLGDRGRNLRRALERLRSVVTIDAVSSVYRSEPVGYREQPDFWNLVVRGQTALPPGELLGELQRIEAELGRTRSFRNAPRPIDIDILLYDDVVLRTSSLTLPHPRMLERGFVLYPLMEVDPEVRHPVTGERIADRLARAEGLERVERIPAGDRLLAGPAEGGEDGTEPINGAGG